MRTNAKFTKPLHRRHDGRHVFLEFRNHVEPQAARAIAARIDIRIDNNTGTSDDADPRTRTIPAARGAPRTTDGTGWRPSIARRFAGRSDAARAGSPGNAGRP